MKNSILLIKKIIFMRFPWNFWILILFAVNFLASFFFLPLIEAKITLGAIIASFIVMVLIFKKYGFVRLLGLGHILFWVPLCLWLFIRFQNDHYSSNKNLFFWILAIMTINSISLLIDFIDVFRYLRGEKNEL